MGKLRLGRPLGKLRNRDLNLAEVLGWRGPLPPAWVLGWVGSGVVEGSVEKTAMEA